MMRRRRSVLYLPASNERAIEKARGLAVDVVILDLEDAVAPENKAVARDQAVAAISQGSFLAGEFVLRINGLDTEWGADDLAAAARMKVDAVLIPKISTAEALVPIAAALPERVQLWAMIETPLAILNIAAIAAASRPFRLAAFVVGTNDLVKDMRIDLDRGRTAITGALSMVVMAARAYGLAALDGVYNHLDDGEGLAAECRQARALGFDGKTLIHPRQVEPCHAAYAPTQAEIEEARRLLAAFELPEHRSKGAIRFEGRMVERLHLEAARRVIAEAGSA